MSLRPAPVAPSRHYLTVAERIAIGRSIQANAAASSNSLGRQIRAAALQYSISPATARRAVAEALAADAGVTRASRAFKPCREVLVRIAMCAGNVSAAHESLQAENHPGLRSYETLHRAIAADEGLQIALRKGMKEFERYLQVGIYETELRNERWVIDEYKVPVRCQTRRGELVEDLWLISILDDFSRLIVAHGVVEISATAEVAEAVLLGAVMGRAIPARELAELGIELLDGQGRLEDGFIGGSPDTIRPDNAKIYESERFIGAATFAGIKPDPARPHLAVDKAKLERFHDTLGRSYLAALPGYTEGPVPHAADDPKVRPYAVPADRDLPRVDAVVEALDAAIEHYNRNHVISTTGQTPIQRWFSMRNPLRTVPPVLFWRFMQPVMNPTRHNSNAFVAGPRGVFVRNAWRTHAALNPYTGGDVLVRQFPGRPGRYFAGLPDAHGGPDRFLCELSDNATLDERQRQARSAANGARAKVARSVLAEAGRQLQREGIPQDGELPTQPPLTLAGPMPRRGASVTDAIAADTADALALGFTPLESVEGAA